jgi:hypothetical protein
MIRFRAHFREHLGQVIVFEIPNNMMTGTQLRLEREEFDSIVKLYSQRQERHKNHSNYRVYTSEDKLNQGEGKRDLERVKMEVKDWHPERLLLLRFGLQDAGNHSKKLWLKKDPLPI